MSQTYASPMSADVDVQADVKSEPTTADAIAAWGDNPFTGGSGSAFSNASPSFRLKGSQVRHVNMADSTPIANTAAATAFDTDFTIKANTLKSGDLVRLTVSGTYSTEAGATSLTWTARLAGTSGAIFGQFGIAVGGVGALTNANWSFQTSFIVRSLGSSGTFRGLGGIAGVNTVAYPVVSVGTSEGAINTTADRQIVLMAQWGSARAGDTIKVGSFLLEVLPSGS